MLIETSISLPMNVNLPSSSPDSTERISSTFTDELDTIVTFLKGGMSISMAPTSLSLYAEHKFIERISPIIHKTLYLLLRNRDFLGHQLNYKSGNLTDEAFERIIQEYLPPTTEYNLSELNSEVRLLMYVSALTFNADQLSVMFNCEIDDAEQVLTALVQNSLNE
jgi:hypothetical protein